MALINQVVRSTRLRYVSSKNLDNISKYFDTIKRRVQIYSIIYDGKKHICWFVPGDGDADIPSKDLDK